MTEIIRISLTILTLTINLVPFFITMGMYFPAKTGKMREIANHLPGRSFGIGMVNFIFFLTIAIMLFSASERLEGLPKVIILLPALILMIILSIGLSFGLEIMSHLLGERVAPTQPVWKQIMMGTLLLGFGGVVPIFGWFLLLPYAAWTGLGAFIITQFQKTRI
jgi:hypothetical protein